jgi:hypothetical protein
MVEMKSNSSVGSQARRTRFEVANGKHALLWSPFVALGFAIAMGGCGKAGTGTGGSGDDGFGASGSILGSGAQSGSAQGSGAGSGLQGTSGGGGSGFATTGGGSGTVTGSDTDDAGGNSGDDAGDDAATTVQSDDSGPGMVTGIAPGETGAAGMPGCGGTLPAMTDYTQNGPFTPTTTTRMTGPGGTYTIVQPTTLGQNGFKHPIAMWGNGITTTPALYPVTLGKIASNGFVIIASESTAVTTADLTTGMDWMIQQNTTAGAFQGKLNTTCLVSIGYSLGGGAAVSAGSHANVVTTVSFHGVTGDSAALKSPLLLFTSVTDTFVVAATFVTPTFDASDVQTFYATLQKDGDPSNLGHLLPVDVLDPNDPERPAAMAWLRYWVYNDQGARKYFWGTDAILCKDPWACQTKKWQ